MPRIPKDNTPPEASIQGVRKVACWAILHFATAQDGRDHINHLWRNVAGSPWRTASAMKLGPSPLLPGEAWYIRGNYTGADASREKAARLLIYGNDVFPATMSDFWCSEPLKEESGYIFGNQADEIPF